MLRTRQSDIYFDKRSYNLALTFKIASDLYGMADPDFPYITPMPQTIHTTVKARQNKMPDLVFPSETLTLCPVCVVLCSFP